MSNQTIPRLNAEGAYRLRDAIDCDECIMDADHGDVCPAHKLLHSLEKQARKWGKAKHLFLAGDSVSVYSTTYRWWDSVNLQADENGLAYAYHVPGSAHSQTTRPQALEWLRRSLAVKS